MIEQLEGENPFQIPFTALPLPPTQVRAHEHSAENLLEKMEKSKDNSQKIEVSAILREQESMGQRPNTTRHSRMTEPNLESLRAGRRTMDLKSTQNREGSQN
mmetsp:Transcript_12763/g.21555  ORF Transcript_12763/g.21555 Transcript_12763/m.21555 type:complete len:102 (-) Transcript_12763:2860-3165(-)